MEKGKQSTFKKTTLIFALSAVAALGAWAAYGYLFHEVEVQGRANAALAKESGALGSEQSQALQLQKDLTANQARQPILASYFVDATDPVPLFETLESYGRTAGVAVTIDTVDVKRQPDRLIVSLTSDGSFTDLYRFVALLESAPYEFTFTQASIKAAPAPVASAVKGAVPAKPAGGTNWEAKVTLSITSVTGAANVSSQK